MGRVKIGDRVVAIRNSNTGTVYLYGRGVYAGDQEVPYWNPDGPSVHGSTWRADVEKTVRAEMSEPQVEWVHRGKPMGVDLYGNPLGDSRTFEERVAAQLVAISGNPRIDLDGGGSAFGYFCWWMPEQQFDARFAGMTVELVPLPDPLPHSLLTATATNPTDN